MNKYAEKQEMPTLQELANILYEDSEIQYVALETQTASKEKIIVGEKNFNIYKIKSIPIWIRDKLIITTSKHKWNRNSCKSAKK